MISKLSWQNWQEKSEQRPLSSSINHPGWKNIFFSKKAKPSHKLFATIPWKISFLLQQFCGAILWQIFVFSWTSKIFLNSFFLPRGCVTFLQSILQFVSSIPMDNEHKEAPFGYKMERFLSSFIQMTYDFVRGFT